MKSDYTYPPLNPIAFRQTVEAALKEFTGLWSLAAEELLLGTCAQESLFGQYRHQIKGPAHGIMQIEEKTFGWLRDKYTKRYPEIGEWKYDHLIHNDVASIVIARLKYWSIPFPLPPYTNLRAQAKYWNKWYNCNPVYGTDEEYIAHYREFLGSEGRAE